MILSGLVILFLSHLVQSVRYKCQTCWDGCHPTDPNKLNIHLVPHTHDDAGWLKTVDQYYYRSQNYLAEGGVQHIIDSVVAELNVDPSRRFAYVESSFLWRWWNDRNGFYRDLMRTLVQQGRLQLLHGGWVMSDEATPHYSMLIDQMMLGLRFLEDKFGVCGKPKVAWQIDPFGHSAEVAQQLVDMGFEGVFYGRIHQGDYEKRRVMKEMEMIWNINPLDNKGSKSELFTGILYNLYHPPPGFCFDIMCNDEPLMDNKELHSYNIDKKVPEFIQKIKIWATSYRTNHVLVPMGGDFTYMMAGTWFVNMDKLIKYGNNDSSVHFLYSTPYCYLKALNANGKVWPVKTGGDFFPYSSSDSLYWTGYYTSRPSLKLLTMKANNILQVVRQLDVLMNLNQTECINKLERAVALAQHHDGISGTAKQHVTDDYLLYLHETIEGVQTLFHSAYKVWTGHGEQHHFCLNTNISACEISERFNKFIIHIYNPLTKDAHKFVRLPVQIDYNYVVYGDLDDEIQSELVPLPLNLLRLPERMGRPQAQDLLFEARNIPPMSFSTYFVQRIDKKKNLTFLRFKSYNEHQPKEEIGFYFTEDFKLIINSNSGELLFLEVNNERHKLQNIFGYYTPSDSGWSYKRSGAYIFRSAKFITLEFPIEFSVYKGKNLIEIHQKYSEWISQVVRIYKGRTFVEFEWMIGPIPSQGDGRTKEIVTRYITSIGNDRKFFTDSNGRRFMPRAYKPHEKIEANYYPVTSAGRISDKNCTLTVLTDRAQGASSPEDGILEFMLNRRTMHDDGKGVNEPLQEKVMGIGLVARGKHILCFHSNVDKDKIANCHRKMAQEIAYSPWMSLSYTHLSRQEWLAAYSKKVPYINLYMIPPNIHILTMQKYAFNKILLRFEHFYDVEEHSILSMPATFQIYNLFRNFELIDMKEMTLGANKIKQCNSRMKWRKLYNNTTKYAWDDYTNLTSFTITLSPMEIKTFFLTVRPLN
ncbi:lysosomal alpha-mannosidase-like isoform X2 [Cimex lectularius]|uniref:Alpha-mannosidase n=1 Tax=Cimex lectularius TaxID=79782 RepID=A0A8I6SG44_CIMLE|nr:lysosomal alpha-mannosidase-like isoform X2 [Cimex lectularius]